MADLLTDLINFLMGLYDNPPVFLLLMFLYAIAIAVVLPIPIELALLPPLLRHEWAYLTGITLSLAAGKTVGGYLVFILGVDVEPVIRLWSRRWRLAKWFVEKAEAFVRKTGTPGLYVLLSIPLMSDTIPIYLYSLFNEEGKALSLRMYLIANFLAALNRVAILVVLFVAVGINLFNL